MSIGATSEPPMAFIISMLNLSTPALGGCRKGAVRCICIVQPEMDLVLS